MYITEEQSDGKLLVAMTTFLANAEANENALGLDAESIGAMTLAFTAFRTKVDAASAARAASVQATAEKNDEKADARALIAQFAQEWRANPAIPDSLLDLMMVPNRQNNGTRTPPTQPNTLKITIGGGETSLSWNKNGNKYGTVYNIESASSPNGPWTTFDITTRSKITFEWPAGTSIWFRVSAKRNNQTSAASQPLALYPGASGVILQEAA